MNTCPCRGTARAGPPLLICFALVNRPYVLDLQPDRSLVRRLLEAGLNVYLIDWGTADEAERRTQLHEYVEAHLGGCVAQVLERSGREALDLLGRVPGRGAQPVLRRAASAARSRA